VYIVFVNFVYQTISEMKGPKKEFFMKLSYKLKIDNPSTHQVLVEIHGERLKTDKELTFFLPRWSPGSYLMREYSRNISKLKAETINGEALHIEQTDISSFLLNFDHAHFKSTSQQFVISYSVFCHELTVRTSHVDESHAYLHLPTLLMGVLHKEIESPTIEVIFPKIWSKITTGLKDISVKREVFLYQANNYDELIDSPIEVGCQETDGFQAFGKDHDLAFYGNLLPHTENIKADTKKIVEHIGNFFGGVPYEKYTFITHFVPGLYGGLEHLNSTALQFCPTQVNNRKGYINYLCLISHEYFHLWNVKRIRPIELGPFNYLTEAKTKLLWLAEGLTSLMDELFVFRAGIISLEEYLELQKENINRYLSVPGRKFHSLNDSSMNAWIKLYRPDENLNNSSVSYYLKGGIVFWALNFMLVKKKKSINDFLLKLWSQYQSNPNIGLTENDVYKIIEEIGGTDVLERFQDLVTTTNEIDLETLVQDFGIKFDWETAEVPWLGIDAEFSGDRVLVKAVTLDGPAYKGGINAGDEILAINGMRVLKDRFNEYPKYLKINQTYKFTVSRLNTLHNIGLNVESTPKKIKSISIKDKELITSALGK
jgi:predicted metalloprotease with PDZ domain